MIKKTVQYEDYFGNQRSEDLYFHLSEAELLELEVSEKGGFSNLLIGITETKDPGKIIAMFKKIILLSYGVRSEDGRRFIKNDEVRNEFVDTAAFKKLYMELATDAEAASDFVNNLIPAELMSKGAQGKRKMPQDYQKKDVGPRKVETVDAPTALSAVADTQPDFSSMTPEEFAAWREQQG